MFVSTDLQDTGLWLRYIHIYNDMNNNINAYWGSKTLKLSIENAEIREKKPWKMNDFWVQNGVIISQLLGMRTKQDLKVGDLVTEYCGEVISSSECADRLQVRFDADVMLTWCWRDAGFLCFVC